MNTLTEARTPLGQILDEASRALAESPDPTLVELLQTFRDQLDRQQKENFQALSRIITKINRISSAIK